MKLAKLTNGAIVPPPNGTLDSVEEISVTTGKNSKHNHKNNLLRVDNSTTTTTTASTEQVADQDSGTRESGEDEEDISTAGVQSDDTSTTANDKGDSNCRLGTI